MGIEKALIKVGEQALAKGGEKALANTATSALSSLLPKVATKVGTDVANKAGTELATKSVLNSLVPTIRTNWKQAGDIEGMLNGKFLGTNENYFPSVFSEGALGRATYGADQPMDQKKVAGLVRAIKNNEDIAPIAGFKNNDGFIDIYDGHHRLAAYQKAGKMPRVKLFEPANKSEAYSYADEWAKNAAKEVEQYLPAKPEVKYGLDENGMGTIDLRGINSPKVSQSEPEIQQLYGSSGYGSLSPDAKKIGSSEVAPINPDTLPGGYNEAKDYLANYKNAVPKAIGKPASKVTKADLVKLLEDYGYDTEGTKWELWNNAQDALEDEFIDKLYEENGEVFARFLGDHRGGGTITTPGAFKLESGNRANSLDAIYSDRLGIGRSHTPMADTLNKHNRYGMDTAGGDYMTNGIGINLNSWGNEGEGGVSTIAHERMHAMQDAGTGWVYDEEFRNAYNDLRNELEPLFHSEEQILKDHPNSHRDLDYWARKNEQEARMLQSYLENEGFTKTGRKPEYGDEIKPAFDKFFDKLRKLSKKGVALPAIIAALFGLGSAGSENDGKTIDNIE